MATARVLAERMTESPAQLRPARSFASRMSASSMRKPGNRRRRFSTASSSTSQPGEFISIVGQTGCGKSTLLRLVLAEEMPTRGQRAGGRQSARRSPIGVAATCRRNIRCSRITPFWRTSRSVWKSPKSASSAASRPLAARGASEFRAEAHRLSAPHRTARIRRRQISAPALRRHAAARGHRAGADHEAARFC